MANGHLIGDYGGMASIDIAGPSWSAQNNGTFAGRFPLAVERHTLRTVDHLLPGITTVTPHARYYTLHALVAVVARNRRLDATAELDLLRRCEVTMAAISCAHGPHLGWPSPHAADRVGPQVQQGNVHVKDLAQPAVYAKPDTGFLGPYLASEWNLGLVSVSGGQLTPGDASDAGALHEGLGDIIGLAERDTLDTGTLSRYSHLCLCQAGSARDGMLLRRLLTADDAPEGSPAEKRSETLKMLRRLLELHPANRAQDLWSTLAYGPLADTDPVLSRLNAAVAWKGAVLRAQMVSAWRELWAGLVDTIVDYSLIRDVADSFADSLPALTVNQYRSELPDIDDGPFLAPAEIDQSVTERHGGDRQLAALVLFAARRETLPTKVSKYFEGADDEGQQLTPTWTSDELDMWRTRPVRDFARHLTETLIIRSQRVALSKATIKKGAIRIPTRVHVVDNMIFKSSSEGSAQVGLRWNQATSVMAGLGMVERDDGRWILTDVGRNTGE